MIPHFPLPEMQLSSLPTGSVKVVVDALGREIAGGRPAPGQTMPMEPELAEKFGVSRTVVREAVKVLSGKGMVRTARRYGTRVCPFEEWSLMDPDVIGWHAPSSPMARRVYAESTTLRCILEPEAAALAAEHATTEQRARILEAAQAIVPGPEGDKAMIGADYAFHATILQATGNIMLSQFQRILLALLNFSYPIRADGNPDPERSLQSHVAVAEAIRDGDAELARERMREMLDGNRIDAARMQLLERDLAARASEGT